MKIITWFKFFNIILRKKNVNHVTPCVNKYNFDLILKAILIVSFTKKRGKEFQATIALLCSVLCPAPVL